MMRIQSFMNGLALPMKNVERVIMEFFSVLINLINMLSYFHQQHAMCPAEGILSLKLEK